MRYVEDVFREACLKIRRADEHIADLESRLNRFSETDSYSIHLDFDPDAGCDLIRLETVLTVPDEFLLIVGDALNNLRSSLDYIMRGICPKARKFPISKTKTELDAVINNGLKSKANASDALRDFILNTIQPYEGGDAEVLWPLHDLNNIDKHRLLIAKTQLTYVNGITGEDENGSPFAISPWLIVYPHIVGHPIEGRHGCKITDKGKATCKIVFGDGMPLQGREIAPALRVMSQMVKHVLVVFETQIRCGLR
jgi:hypothetical protein